MKKEIELDVKQAIISLVESSLRGNPNLQMPGDGRYQPKALKSYLGYDQWAGWLIIVEWFWMKTLAKVGKMPKEDAKCLTKKNLIKLLFAIKTTDQDEKEKETKHDILALLALMRVHLPEQLHKWLHFCATSYDIINTAYALQLRFIFEDIFMPKLLELDSLWREKILENTDVIQAGRTHLQTALPVTVGFWLANLHNRFINSARIALDLSKKVPGKFSGAVGTYASQRVLINFKECEKTLMEILDLPVAQISTQITPPEGNARFYNELVLLSGVLANLGDDTRILQSSQFGEILSASSSSSAMSHKRANPIAAENLAGMHVTVIAEYMKIAMTLTSNLQRDLRWSNVMRSYSAVLVYFYQQILTAEKLFKSLKIDREKCLKNYFQSEDLITAELLHLFLQKEGVADAHEVVNKKIIPITNTTGGPLYFEAEAFLLQYKNLYPGLASKLRKSEIADYLRGEKKYIGDSVEISRREAKNKL